MKYKLLALDLDHTALNSDTEIPQENVKAIARARAAGIYVLPATGRSPVGTRDVWRDMGFDDLAICFSGAQIFNMRTFSSVMTECISREVTKDALTLGAELNLETQIYIGHDMYVVTNSDNVKHYCKKLHMPRGIETPDLFTRTWDNVIKVIYYAPHYYNHIDMAHMRDTINARLGDRVAVTASTCFVELNAIGHDKGTGLRYVCDKLGLSLSQAVAAGDSLLDVEMIHTAGLGVAIADGSPDAIAAADIIAPDQDSSPIAWIVDYMLKS